MTAKYTLSFDPGGSSATWAYCLSKVRDSRYQKSPSVGGSPQQYIVVEAGFVPVLEDIALPDFSAHQQFLADLFTKYPLREEGCDLVAERYVGRGHTGWMNEYIPFALGWYAAQWNSVGLVRMIMAAQWKVPLKKMNSGYKLLCDRYENWWEDHYDHWLPSKLQQRGICHVQDACAMGYWYNFKILQHEVSVPGF